MLARSDGNEWLSPSDVRGLLIVLVHGFTSHGAYLRRLATYMERQERGYTTALFTYNSFAGIGAAVDALVARLRRLEAQIRQHGCVLIGHSMGGLVARYFAQAADEFRPFLRGLCLIGTPNRGTLESRVVSLLISVGENVGEVDPYSRSAACTAALELTGSDPGKLISVLNDRERADKNPVPTMSISGGLAYLDFPRLPDFARSVANNVVQIILKDARNDGLVTETSADIRNVATGQSYSHVNNYPEFKRTNHSYLTSNQQVADLIIDWIGTRELA